MFIKRIRIIKNTNNEIIREQKFHRGANFVVDTENSDHHNKVGKTTFLNLINIALGAKNKKRLYSNYETGSINEKLRDYIINNKISVQLDLINEDENFTLNVALYPRGKRSINGVEYNQKEYNSKLNKIIFNNKQDTPTFRQLLKSFLRIDLGKDDNSFLHNLPIITSTSTYRAVYNYLFDISDPKEDTDRDSLNKKLRDVEQAEKRYIEVSNVPEKYELEQIISTLKQDEDKLDKELNDILNRKDFEKNRIQFNKVRNEYTELLQHISDIKFRIKQNKNNIDENEAKNKEISTSLVHDFFDEVNDLIPNLNKEYDELVAFNKSIQQNKIKYVNEINKDLEQKLNTLEKQREELVTRNKEYISLIKDDKIDEYYELSDKYKEVQESINNKKNQLDELNNFEKEIYNLNQKIKSLDKKKKHHVKYPDRMEQFNKYFRPFALNINGEHPILTYNPDTSKFPLTISDLNNGTGTGTTKSLIAAYDLAYQKFAQDINKNVPNFIVQDVLENIEGKNLKSIIEISNKLDAQYIIAILNEKLDSAGLSEEEQRKLTVVSLSNSNKPFRDNKTQKKAEENAELPLKKKIQ